MLIKTKDGYVSADDLQNTGKSIESLSKAGIIRTDRDARKIEKHWSYLSGGDTGSGSIYRGQPITDWHLILEYLNNPIVYQCAEKNATQVASTTKRFVQLVSSAAVKSGKHKRLSKAIQAKYRNELKISSPDSMELVEVQDSDFENRLNQNTEDLNWHQLLHLTDIYLEVLGRAYWYCDTDESGNGRTTVMKPHAVIPLRDINGYVVGYTYYNYVDGMMVGGRDPGGADFSSNNIYDRDEVIDFRFPLITDPYGMGFSPTRAALRSIRLSSQFMDYQNTTVGNRRRMDYIVSGVESEEEKLRIEKKLDEKLGGENNGKPLVTEGKLTVTPTNWAPTDLAPLQINEKTLEQISGAYGIPPALISKDATYSNLEGSLELWGRQALCPRVHLIQETLNGNKDKLQISDDVMVVFDSPTPEDDSFELEEAKVNVTKAQIAVMTNGVVTKDELRDMLGLEALPTGGDELIAAAPTAPETPNDDKTHAPEDQQPPTVQNDSTDDSEGKHFDQLLQLNRDVSTGTILRSVAISLAAKLLNVPDESAKQFITHLPKQKTCGCGKCDKAVPNTAKPIIYPEHKELVPIIQKAYDRLHQHYLSQVERPGKGFEGVITKALPDQFVPMEDWTDDLANEVQPVVEIFAKQTAKGKQIELTRAGASPDVFSVMPAKIKEATRKLTLQFAQSTLDTTDMRVNAALKAVRQSIADGLTEGEAVTTIADRINEVFTDLNEDHANLIAQTETQRAVHLGQKIAAQESGIVKGWKWLASSDACPICLDLDGKEIAIDDDTFFDATYGDGDQPPAHPNCECTMLEIIDTDAVEGDNEEEGDE